MSYFKTAQGKDEILQLYDKKLDELNIEYEYLKVNTSFGETNIIVTGNADKPPLLVIHGSNGCAPIALETYPNLSLHYRVYAVDVLSQPNKSAETRLSMKDHSYGIWMSEIIQKLVLNDIVIVGFSFGGLVILKTLEYDDSKIKEVHLAAPAYIVNGNPLKALFKVFIPMRKYMKTLNKKYVEQFLAELFTERDDFAVPFLSKVFQHFTMDFTSVPTISKKAAKRIQTPIYLYAAKKDLIFPGEKMIKRAKKIFPSIVKTILFEQSKHVQSRKENQQIESQIIRNED